jgi:hypothetical protein
MRLVLTTLVLSACGPGRTTFARHPAGATAFDRAGTDPKALAIADRVVAAAGGAERWSQVKQLKWSMSIEQDGKVALTFDEAWDRWNGRHHGRLHKVVDMTKAADTNEDPTRPKSKTAGDVVVMRKLYEPGGSAYFDTGRGLQALEAPQTQRAIETARERWQHDTVAMCMPFLLEEPGTKLEYIGEVPGEEGKPPLDDLRVTLDPRDPDRTASYHVMVNRETNLIDRLDIILAGQPETQRFAYRLRDWVDVGGMKFATVDENIAAGGEIIKFKDISVGSPDESLYVPAVE